MNVSNKKQISLHVQLNVLLLHDTIIKNKNKRVSLYCRVADISKWLLTQMHAQCF